MSWNLNLASLKLIINLYLKKLIVQSKYEISYNIINKNLLNVNGGSIPECYIIY